MQKDERDLLEVLKFELKFLEDGGYGKLPSARWRPQLIFEDSPTCANFNSAEEPVPCTDCVLIHLVPPEFRSSEIPCRHIPLDQSGETLDSLYRYSDQGEIEDVFGSWLRKTITRLEEERAVARRTLGTQPAQSAETLRGTPLFQKKDEGGAFDRTVALHPKCANPACPAAFHWTDGGKFFRFRPDSGLPSAKNSTPDAKAGTHGVRHYWLCERCSQMFTLVHDEQCGVVLKALWPELPRAEESSNVKPAA
ncbi:MAG TPA: hypothetical protein VJN89_14390 [Candidatus Acidoferrum sp.]|nr:hypothetical protein [Candidatus Acidoferrum sp.]